MTTATLRARLRADLGLTDAEMDDTEADALFARAAETYTSDAAIYAYTRLLGLDQLLIQAAKDTDYEQADSSEKASQRFAHLLKLRPLWERDLAVAVASSVASVRVVTLKRKPAKYMELPGS